ncbi:hypothetical protein BKA70DRAFT_1342256 [Coprinopsis sp. MPI-PUGE-AT-0042]|nr:hypothetical protein BKA70DRAFT_1342256 [Coprinopsis sp. MPI-PUGE-AT-0042]
MFWSDETHLSAFGSAKVWPCYMFFGNESKYQRSKTSLKLCEHIAYFDSLSDDFKDYLRQRNGGKVPPKELLSHCSREMFHAQWNILLGDPELLKAMETGIVLASSDGLQRRFFPVIFTYSADYPEKTRIALIKQNGCLPCPTCLMPKSQVHNMGTPEDIAFRLKNPRLDDKENRAMISKALRALQGGYAITGKVVEGPIKSRSLLPIQNAFSTHLGKFGFDVYQSLVVDLMHEFEIGVWKGLYMHLLRLLEAFGKQDLISELDERYRHIPSFGRDTIRKFSKNASECKRRAARDYEDLLQCSIAAFEGLLPSPHNEIVMELLFLLCNWHALAKLRMHHDQTLEMLEQTTVMLASQFRKFQQETCQRVVTVELQREAQARARRAASKATTAASDLTVPLAPVQDSFDSMPGVTTAAATATQGSIRLSDSRDSLPPDARGQCQASTLSTEPERIEPKSNGSLARREKKYSLSTPKYHALGHYVQAIRSYGTTDSFTSEIGETNHPVIKTWYKRTDRRKYSMQFSKISRRQARFRRMKARLFQSSGDDCSSPRPSGAHLANPVVLGVDAPTQTQYYIGESKSYKDLNATFTNSGSLFDPVVVAFIPKLKQYLYPRILHLLAPSLYDRVSTTDPGARQAEADWAGVVILNNRIYTHQIMQVKYTTYDVRREADTIRLKAEPNIMVLDTRDKEQDLLLSTPPYRYARVLGIFHANVLFVGELSNGTRDYTPHRIDFLWVRWYTSSGFPATPALERLHFEPVIAGSESIGFLDPRQVVRAVHLIPQFTAGKQPGHDGKKSPWLGKQPFWNFYYINRFADRDMYMRYHWRLAVGHAAIQRRCRKSRTAVGSNHADQHTERSLFPSLEEPLELPGSDESDNDDSGAEWEYEYDTGSDDEE